jgi:hypothetical protein
MTMTKKPLIVAITSLMPVACGGSGGGAGPSGSTGNDITDTTTNSEDYRHLNTDEKKAYTDCIDAWRTQSRGDGIKAVGDVAGYISGYWYNDGKGVEPTHTQCCTDINGLNKEHQKKHDVANNHYPYHNTETVELTYVYPMYPSEKTSQYCHDAWGEDTNMETCVLKMLDSINAYQGHGYSDGDWEKIPNMLSDTCVMSCKEGEICI